MDISVRYLDTEGAVQTTPFTGSLDDLESDISEIEYLFNREYGTDYELLEVIAGPHGYLTVAGVLHENNLDL